MLLHKTGKMPVFKNGKENDTVRPVKLTLIPGQNNGKADRSFN